MRKRSKMDGIVAVRFSGLAGRLKSLREDRGESQTAVSKATGIGNASVSQYERGDRLPDIEGVMLLADHFGVSIDYLMGRSETKTVSGDDQGDRLLLTSAVRECFLRLLDDIEDIAGRGDNELHMAAEAIALTYRDSMAKALKHTTDIRAGRVDSTDIDYIEYVYNDIHRGISKMTWKWILRMKLPLDDLGESSSKG